MKIELNLTKTRFFLLIFVILLFAGSIVAYAYSSTFTGSNPTKFGHSADEVNVKLSDGTIISLEDAITQGKLSTDSSSGASSHFIVLHPNSGIDSAGISFSPSSGSYSINVPVGVTAVKFECWGGGGGGGTTYGPDGSVWIAGSGGGAGGYAEGLFSVSAGKKFTITVGSGGAEGSSGGTTSVSLSGNNYLNCNGGGGGAPPRKDGGVYYVFGANGKGGSSSISSQNTKISGGVIFGSDGYFSSGLRNGQGGESYPPYLNGAGSGGDGGGEEMYGTNPGHAGIDGQLTIYWYS